jgi:type III pantothenate kinase
MKLLFDIGNTRIKWAYDSGSELLYAGEVTHRGSSVEDVSQVIAALEHPADEIWAVNVAGDELAKVFTTAIIKRFGASPYFVRTAHRYGEVVNGYEDVSQHGVDRWAAVVGAWYQYRSNVCVVDVGTAMTIDLVRADGQHEGGFILPGTRLMTTALHRDTSDIEAFSGRRKSFEQERWCGNDTLSAVQLGAVFALRAAVTESARMLGKETRVVLTGGDADALLPLSGIEYETRPLLVLEGLQRLAAAEH